MKPQSLVYRKRSWWKRLLRKLEGADLISIPYWGAPLEYNPKTKRFFARPAKTMDEWKRRNGWMK